MSEKRSKENRRNTDTFLDLIEKNMSVIIEWYVCNRTSKFVELTNKHWKTHVGVSKNDEPFESKHWKTPDHSFKNNAD